MGACVFGSDDFALNAALAEARTDDDAGQAGQPFENVSRLNLLAIDKMNLCLHIIINAGQVQTLADALVSVLQIVFPYQPDVHLPAGFALLLEKSIP